MTRQSKHNARGCRIDGIWFQSQMEGRRYRELKLLELVGDISRLHIHTKWSLDVNGVHICNYVDDFNYWQDGRFIVEDVKGQRLPLYKVKCNLMRAVHGIVILETTA